MKHTTYGLGVVIGATAKMIRVRFDEDGKERSVRLTSLSEIDADENAGEAKAEPAAAETSSEKEDSSDK